MQRRDTASVMAGLRFVNGPDEFVAGCDGILIEAPHKFRAYHIFSYLIFSQITEPVVTT